MKNLATLAAVATALVATPALAHEGPYIGVIGGYDSVTAKVDGDSGSEDEIMYGVAAGYDIHVSEFVMAGIEAEYADSSVKIDDTDGSVRAGRDLYVGGRLGYHVTPSTAIYAKAGYTNAQLKIVADADDFNYRASENLDGFRLGGGIEHSFDQVGVRLEYRYSDYGRLELFGQETDLMLSRHQVVAGVFARF